MLQVDLSAKELDIFEHVLAHCISDLGTEIAHTDRLDYRDMLKERRATLTRVLAAVREAPRPDAG